MTLLDSIFIAIVVILVIRCTLRGFVEEVLSLAAPILGALAALLLVKPVATYIRHQWNLSVMSEVLAFIGIFVVVFLVVKVFHYILADIMDRINLEGIDRFLGFFLGILEGVLVISLVVFGLHYQPFVDTSQLLETSIFARILLPLVSEFHRAALQK
ncbi:MAG: CvpA family protein [Treponemataceae bacterium]|nr:CvpA family protein [Treponemataceae bacterium]